MEVRLKERLIGGLVVVAVAVLVLPWILDDDKGDKAFTSQIPPSPPAPTARAVELSQPRPLDEAGFDDSIIAAETTATRSADLPETAPPSQSNPATQSAPAVMPEKLIKPERPAIVEAGFVIQLGSFTNRENAEKLVQTLRSHKLAAYTKVDSRAVPTVVRVLVGPMVKREVADAQLAKVRTLSGQNAIVVAYDPLKH